MRLPVSHSAAATAILSSPAPGRRRRGRILGLEPGSTNCSQWGAMGRRGHNEGAANATDDPPGGRMDSPASPYSQSNGAFKHWRGPPHTLQRWGALPPGKVCKLLHRLRGLLALRRRTVHQSVAPSLQAHSVLSTRK